MNDCIDFAKILGVCADELTQFTRIQVSLVAQSIEVSLLGRIPFKEISKPKVIEVAIVETPGDGASDEACPARYEGYPFTDVMHGKALWSGRRRLVPLVLSCLDNLRSLGGSLELQRNAMMQSACGIDSLTKVGGDLTIRSNPQMESLNGLHRLAFVGGQLSIEHQPYLDSLDALYGVRRVGGTLELSNNRLLDAQDVRALRDSIGESAIGCYLEPEF